MFAASLLSGALAVPKINMAETLSERLYSLPQEMVFRDKLHLRIENFLCEDLAEAARVELLSKENYSPVPGLGFLKPLHQHQTAVSLLKCCDILKCAKFLGWLSAIDEQPLRLVEQPAFFRMEHGNRIKVHDDVSFSPKSRLSVVIHLSRNWQRGDGGNTVIGPAKIIRPRSPGADVEWVFSGKRSILSPVFNSIVILRLGLGLAHCVTPIRGERTRLSIVARYESL